MGLINLKTNLKSLKYGKDRVGGGSSGQPFVQKPIPEDFSSVGQRYTNLVQARIDDVSRLTQLLVSGKSTDGLLFSAKQNTLSRLGVQTQASPKGLNEGAYLPTSTIAQAAVQGLGIHLNKQGLNPYPGGPGAIINYSDVVTSTQSTGSNRLVGFAENFVNKKSNNPLYSYPGGPGSNYGVGSTNISTAAFRTGVNITNGIVSGFRTVNISGVQQPGNVVEPTRKWTWGGLTTLNTPYKAYEYANAIPKGGLNARQTGSLTENNWYTGTATWTKQWTPDAVFSTGSLLGATRKYLVTAGSASEANLSSYWNLETGSKLWNPNVYDTGTLGLNSAVTASSRNADINNPYGSNYITINGSGNPQRVYSGSGSDSGYKVGNPVPSLNTGSFDKSQAGVAARLSSSPLSKSNSFRSYLKNLPTESVERAVFLGNPASNRPTGSISYDQINALEIGETKTDLIDFKIEVIGGSIVQFRAFLDNFSDNFSAEWGSEQFTGRGEKFYTYTGYERKINLGWTIAAQSSKELKPMYQRLNYLASAATPSYRSGFLRGNLLRLTVGDYIVGVPGKFDGLDISIVDNSPWDISTGSKMPMVLKVSGFSFTPIHDFVPELGKKYISFTSYE